MQREEIKQLSNDELKSQLKSAKISCGPITTTTRKIYESRLIAHFEIQRNNKRESEIKSSGAKNKFDHYKNIVKSEVTIENEQNKEEVDKRNCQIKENNNKESDNYLNTVKSEGTNENEQNQEVFKENCQVKENNSKNTKVLNDIDTNVKEIRNLLITPASIDENHFAVGNQQQKPDLKIDITINGLENNEQVDGNIQTTTAKEEIGDGFFYGVWVPVSPSRIKLKNKPKVFFSQKTALEAVKRYNGSRFKQFKNKEEAEKFSLTPPNLVNVDSVISMVANTNKESLTVPRVEAFKAPTIQEVQKFRKFIEDGDMYNFQKCINNPKYLINSKDFPVVVHEGMRSNALHVAIKCDRLNMCSFIMDRVTSIQTYVDLYPETSVENLEFRKEHVEKLFLNTPEKIVSFINTQ